MDSKFNSDLSKEEVLGRFLDKIYPTVLQGYQIERINNIENQYQGIDLIITKEGKNHYIDEKAQLDYLNKTLPTFAFELSYIKNNVEKLGWLFDNAKKTDYYFLINGIYLNIETDINKGFKVCNIISVNRLKLIALLESKGLDFNKAMKINDSIRSGTEEGTITTIDLNPRIEGRFHFSKSNKLEQPINLVLYIDFLLESKVAKKIH